MTENYTLEGVDHETGEPAEIEMSAGEVLDFGAELVALQTEDDYEEPDRPDVA